ncbi:MAG: TonB-dependent receptor [Bacteroidales bacterium]|nr:TonB-dependent receptor [Bacteroidales bacterium]
MNHGKTIYRILITCLLLIAASVAFAQNLDNKISIKAKNQPLGEIIDQISEKGNILFSFNPQSIPVHKKINVDARNTSLSKIFEMVFTANGIDYILSEKQVILKLAKQETLPKPDLSVKQIRKFTISGTIRDKATGEVIIGANVYDMASMQGTTSNAYGFYSLTLPTGEYRITNSYIGYSPVSQVINLNKDINATIDLELAVVEMNTVVITSDPDVETKHLNQTGDMHFSPTVLKQIPGFAGNVDVLKSLQNVPGVLTFGDGSSFYYVRGGNSDQNLLLIDEAPIYNPSHLFGFFSALAPDAIKDVMVYKGDFPANYGGRLSSVIDVRAREGNQKRIGISGNIGPYTSDLTLEGPILKDKSSFIISGRKSNMNWLNLSFDDQRSYKFDFYDINAKLNVKINKNNRLFLTAFKGNDVFERYNSSRTNTFGISWKNVAGTLRWNHTFNSKLFSNTMAYISRYNYFLDISKELGNYWTSSITNATIKTDFSWYLNPKNTIKTGFEFNRHESNPGKMYYSDKEIPASLAGYYSNEIAIYASIEQQIGQKFFARYGFRLSRWSDLGPTSVYFFDANHNVIDTIDVAGNTIYKSFLTFEPRISLKYALGKNSSLHVNYNRNVQHLQMLSNSTSPFTSLDVWVPSGPNIKPQIADQVSLGFFTRIFQSQFDFSIEAYYKRLYNQIDYKDHANMLINQLIEGELRFGDGWSYGFETMLRKSKGKFTGWISYTLSRSYKQIEGVNNGEKFPTAYHRPHNACITLSYATRKRWNFSSHWMYMTGSPFSSPTGFYYVNGSTVPIYGKKNNDRYPDYHRLDVSVSYTFSKPEKRYQHSLMLTIYNAYGRHNPFSVNFNKITDAKGDIVVPANLASDLELISTSISVAGAIPSLNYTFRF